jgi:hypothetical protein
MDGGPYSFHGLHGAEFFAGTNNRLLGHGIAVQRNMSQIKLVH